MADAEYFKLDDGTVLAVADATARQKIGSDTLDTEAQDLSGAVNELKGTLDELSNLKVKTAFNANSIDVDFGFVPSTSNGGQILLFNSNQGTVALITFGVTPGSAVVFGTKTYNVSVSGTVITITPNSTLWGITTLLIDERHI